MAPEIVGLVPAAGWARRLGPLPCSKEIFPVGFAAEGGDINGPDVPAAALLRKFRAAGARKAFIVLRAGKWDIPAYLGDGSRLGIHLAYLLARLPFGSPFTLDAARPFLRGATVVFGFPDILFEPDDAYASLLEKRAADGAEIVLGLFPARRPETADMVELDGGGRVRRIVLKPRTTGLRHAWIIAVWGPEFTEFLHQQLAPLVPPPGEASHEVGGGPAAGAGPAPAMPLEGGRRELHVGHVVQAAIDAGLRVDAVTFEDGRYVDIGTPDALREALSRPDTR